MAQEAHRPQSFTVEQVVAAMIEARGLPTVAADILGCTYQTVNNYEKRYKKEITAARKEGRARSIHKIFNRYLDRLEGGKASCKDMHDGLMALARDLGFAESKPQEAAHDPIEGPAKSIYKKLLKKEIAPTEAALELEIMGAPITDTLREMIRKEPVEQIDESAGMYATVDEEEMERMAAERKRKVAEEQADWLPQRQAEVKELKETVADSFGQGSMPEEKPKREEKADGTLPEHSE